MVLRGMLLAALLAAATPGQALPLTTFEFTGNCTDCARAAGTDTYAVFASLTLRGYTPGTALTRDAFHAFTYGGSNLVDGFSVDRDDWDAARNRVLNGLIAATAGAPTHLHLRLVHADRDLWSCTSLGRDTARSGPACGHTRSAVFRILTDGTWSFGAPPKDVGNGMVALTDVPEPGAALLTALGLIGLRLTSRRTTG